MISLALFPDFLGLLLLAVMCLCLVGYHAWQGFQWLWAEVLLFRLKANLWADRWLKGIS